MSALPPFDPKKMMDDLGKRISDRLTVECCDCKWRFSGHTEQEVKDAADLHNDEQHPDCEDIKWEWVQ